MGAGASLGAIFARLGIDTSEFQVGMQSSYNALGTLANGANATSPKLAQLGRVAASTGSAFMTMGATSVAGIMPVVGQMQNLYNATSQVAMSTAKAGTNMAALSETAMTAGLAVVGLAVIYKGLDYSVRGWMQATMLAQAPAAEMADAMMANSQAYDNAYQSLQRLASGMKVTIDLDLGKHTRANAEQILYLQDSLTKELATRRALSPEYERAAIQTKLMADRVAEENRQRQGWATQLRTAKEAQEQFNASWGKSVPGYLQVQIAMAKGREEMKALGDESRKTFGIMNAGDVKSGLDNITKQMIAIYSSGGSAKDIIEKMGPTLLDLVAKAKEMGLPVSQEMDRVATAVKDGAAYQLDYLLKRFRETPKEAGDASGAASRALEEMGKDLAGKISGGFGKAVEQGKNFAQQQMDEWHQKNDGMTLKIKLDLDDADFQRRVADIIAGNIPHTSGGVP